VQEIGINVTTNFEKTRINITNPDDTKWFIMFTSSTLKQNNSKECKGTASAGEVRNCLWNYYRDVHGTQIDVGLEMYDANDTITTSTANRVKNVYTVKLRKLIGPTPTITAATAVKKTASS
jgi:hypothetical protein